MLKTLVLVKESDMAKIESIKENYEGPEDLYELFCDLIRIGRTESYDESRIYCLAYVLSKNGIRIRLGLKSS